MAPAGLRSERGRNRQKPLTAGFSAAHGRTIIGTLRSNAPFLREAVLPNVSIAKEMRIARHQPRKTNRASEKLVSETDALNFGRPTRSKQ
jgi:hypothetical protein